MNQQEWHNWRNQGIGSSDAPVIMGVSPWTTPAQLWEERVHGAKREDNASMKYGREMEEHARRFFEKKMNVQVFATREEHKSIKWMRATLDGIDIDRKVMVEIKCPSNRKLNHKVPDHYYPQLQHQLEVTGLDGMYYCSFDGTDGVILEVPRDPFYIKSLVQEESKFWNCILELEMPPLMNKDFADLSDDEQWDLLSRQYISNNAKLKELEKKEEELRAALISYSANKNVQGAGLRVSRSLCKGSVDYSLIPELQGVDLDRFRKNSYTKYRISVMS